MNESADQMVQAYPIIIIIIVIVIIIIIIIILYLNTVKYIRH